MIFDGTVTHISSVKKVGSSFRQFYVYKCNFESLLGLKYSINCIFTALEATLYFTPNALIDCTLCGISGHKSITH